MRPPPLTANIKSTIAHSPENSIAARLDIEAERQVDIERGGAGGNSGGERRRAREEADGDQDAANRFDDTDGDHQRHRRLESDGVEEGDHIRLAAGDAEELPQPVRDEKGAGDEPGQRIGRFGKSLVDRAEDRDDEAHGETPSRSRERTTALARKHAAPMPYSPSTSVHLRVPGPTFPAAGHSIGSGDPDGNDRQLPSTIS